MYKDSGDSSGHSTNMNVCILGLHRIVIWPYIWLNSNVEFSSEKNVPLFSFQKICLYRSLLNIDIILFVKTISDFKLFF